MTVTAPLHVCHNHVFRFPAAYRPQNEPDHCTEVIPATCIWMTGRVKHPAPKLSSKSVPEAGGAASYP